MTRYIRRIALLPLVLFVAASVICGLLLDGYSHREHPLALLGAMGVQGARVFNATAFLLPGVLAALVAWTLRSNLQEGMRWQGRIGMQLVLLSALAFAGQGVFPLDPGDIGGEANALHATVWTAWWMSFLAGATLLIFARQAQSFRWATAIAAGAMLAFALLPWPGVMAAFAPRLAFVVWLVWVGLAPRLTARSG